MFNMMAVPVLVCLLVLLLLLGNYTTNALIDLRQIKSPPPGHPASIQEKQEVLK